MARRLNTVNTISNIPYVSDTFFEREKRIWRTTWLVAGRVSDLDEKGKFITLDLAAINVSVFVVRQDSGGLKAFYNICPHRNGRLLCDEQGRKAAITCRYHGWTFQLDGKLRGIPEEHLFPGIDKNDCSLAPVAVDTWGGFVFVNLDPAPEHTLAEYLKDVPSGLEVYLADPDWRWYTGYQKTFKANWKDLLNIQHEGYHASHVHKKTLGVYFTPEDCANTLFEGSPGVCSRLTVQRPLASGELLAKMTTVQHLAMRYGTTSNWVDQDTSIAAERVADSVNLGASDRWVFDCYTFFPNLLLFVGTDVLTLMISWPVDAHESVWEIDWFHKDKLRNFGNLFSREQGRLATRNALTEDWPVVEWAHRNMRAGVIGASTIGSDMEATVWAHYAKLLQHLDLSERELENEYT